MAGSLKRADPDEVSKETSSLETLAERADLAHPRHARLERELLRAFWSEISCVWRRRDK